MVWVLFMPFFHVIFDAICKQSHVFYLEEKKSYPFQSPEGKQLSKVATEIYLVMIATQLKFWVGVS
jgi:hypothetical protein